MRWIAGIAAALVACIVVLKGIKNPVVEFVHSEATEWRPKDKHLNIGDEIDFKSGLVELRYLKGVRLVIEAPARFEITGQNSGYLHHGKLVAEVDDARAHGFVIDSPSGRLVDLGTKFAVAVKGSGEMEVHVINGQVDATVAGGKTERLTKDQAIRMTRGFTSNMPADIGKFITHLPSYESQSPGFVRWSFDESIDSGSLANTGRDLAGELATAYPHSLLEGGSVPQTIADAPFGNGIRFDGKSGYLESNFHGISGSNPRTVTFWVRAPKEFNPLEGYGIINWGDIKTPGGAWQISINPDSNDGPQGRLRIGTQKGQVVGTTDLRDNKWHHCAVVLYGDEEGKPNTATHILLYVDGEIEPAARKSVFTIDTADGPEDRGVEHGIWIGRNLAYEYDGSIVGDIYGKLFRGDIDELIICNSALNQQQLRKLMTENIMP